HLPRRMLQGLLGCDSFKVLSRCFAKRPTRGGQDQAAYFTTVPGPQALIEGAVLAVDRNQQRSSLPGSFAQKLTGHDHRFLVGEGYCFARCNCTIGWVKSRSANSSRNNDVDISG